MIHFHDVQKFVCFLYKRLLRAFPSAVCQIKKLRPSKRKIMPKITTVQLSRNSLSVQ